MCGEPRSVESILHSADKRLVADGPRFFHAERVDEMMNAIFNATVLEFSCCDKLIGVSK
jgi:hypothetical protein